MLAPNERDESAVDGGNWPMMNCDDPVALSLTAAYGMTAPEPPRIRISALPVSNAADVIAETGNCVCVNCPASVVISRVPSELPDASRMRTSTTSGESDALPDAATKPMLVRNEALLMMPGM